MSATNRRAQLANDGYTFHSAFMIGDDLIAEFYTKDGRVFHWFPDEHPQDLSGNSWKKAVAMNEYERLSKEMKKGDGNLSVRQLHGSWWRQILGCRHDSLDGYDVLRFTYYNQPFAAVTREALTLHFDETMDRVEDLVNAQSWPERAQIIAETPAWIFFGEPGRIEKLEQECGVTA